MKVIQEMSRILSAGSTLALCTLCFSVRLGCDRWRISGGERLSPHCVCVGLSEGFSVCAVGLGIFNLRVCVCVCASVFVVICVTVCLHLT